MASLCIIICPNDKFPFILAFSHWCTMDLPIIFGCSYTLAESTSLTTKLITTSNPRSRWTISNPVTSVIQGISGSKLLLTKHDDPYEHNCGNPQNLTNILNPISSCSYPHSDTARKSGCWNQRNARLGYEIAAIQISRSSIYGIIYHRDSIPLSRNPSERIRRFVYDVSGVFRLCCLRSLMLST